MNSKQNYKYVWVSFLVALAVLAAGLKLSWHTPSEPLGTFKSSDAGAVAAVQRIWVLYQKSPAQKIYTVTWTTDSQAGVLSESLEWHRTRKTLTRYEFQRERWVTTCQLQEMEWGDISQFAKDSVPATCPIL